MDQKCDLLSTCGFFKKHNETNELACQGLIAQYCKGPKMNQCKRKEYRDKHGSAPTDDMLPGGGTLKLK
ncbi:MAG: hypothetical protein SVR08_03105 [Spirochaetota bacterium]|nr:hypothetical protein [Spirochaetota bacterium]